MSEAEKKNKRPVLKLPLTKYEKILEILSGIGVLWSSILVIALWKTIPEKIPTHFSLSGMPDSWGGKGSLVFLSILILVLYLFLSIISKYPHTFNYPCKITEVNAKFQYQNACCLIVIFKTEIIWSIIYVQWKSIQIALGNAKGLSIFYLPIFLFIIIGTTGVSLYKARK